MPPPKEMDHLWQMGYDTIRELETDQGILASGRNEIFGCIFGRDSLITALKLLKVYQKNHNDYFLALVKKVLFNLIALQGKVVNIESGEQPGKCIHEYRPTNHERLTKNLAKPWYVYPDGTMRNYDSVDATPLLLIAMYQYYAVSKDEEFLSQTLLAIHNALHWLLDYGDSNKDGFIDYIFPDERIFGGLKVQSWMDSEESVFHEDGRKVTYPIAPVEVQAYAYTALRAWATYFAKNDRPLGEKLSQRADALKKLFNEKFVVNDGDQWSLAFAIDGNGAPLTSARSSMGHCLWAAFTEDANGNHDSIVDTPSIPFLVKRLMSPDLFEPKAGIRTLSTKSRCFFVNSYHNGSIWPHDNSLIIEGLLNFGYKKEAEQVRQALLAAFQHYKTPIELFAYDKGYVDYRGLNGQGACKKQAWSAASLLSETA